MEHYLPQANAFADTMVGKWTLVRELGRGKNGVVYLATRAVSKTKTIESALKVIPQGNLRDGWEAEFEKTTALSDLPEIVQYREHSAEILASKLYVCIVWEYVNGPNLRDYARANPAAISLSFIENLIRTMLRAFVAMEATRITHGDLHDGNILIKHDPRVYDEAPLIKISDFGIVGSRNSLRPKDDYIELATICHDLLDSYVDPAALGDGREKQFFSFLVENFLPKYILEVNPSIGEYVKNARHILKYFETATSDLKSRSTVRVAVELRKPFDYLSCEQIGDSFELLQTLYSSNFPGYDDLLQPANTILTGPRGCGKTTVFRNLSLRAQLLGRKRTLADLDNFIGIYYHCGDLFFPFHHLRHTATEGDRKLLTHYFNLALTREILDTCIVCQDQMAHAFSSSALTTLEGFIKPWFPKYQTPPAGTPILRHVMSVVDFEKHRIGTQLRKRKRVLRP